MIDDDLLLYVMMYDSWMMMYDDVMIKYDYVCQCTMMLHGYDDPWRCMMKPDDS